MLFLALGKMHHIDFSMVFLIHFCCSSCSGWHTWCWHRVLQWCELTPANAAPLFADTWERLQLKGAALTNGPQTPLLSCCFQQRFWLLRWLVSTPALSAKTGGSQWGIAAWWVLSLLSNLMLSNCPMQGDEKSWNTKLRSKLSLLVPISPVMSLKVVLQDVCVWFKWDVKTNCWTLNQNCDYQILFLYDLEKARRPSALASYRF